MINRNFIILVLAVLFFVVSCFSTTRSVQVWSDAELVKKYNSVLVIGVFHRPNARKVTEDLFVAQLGGTDAKALTSYETIDDLSGKNRRKFIYKIKSIGTEAVLVIRLIELKNKQEYEPLTAYQIPYPYYSKLQSYLRETELDKGETNDKVIYGIAVAEATLYDVTTEKLVWKAVSDLHLQDSATEIMQSFAKAIVKELKNGQLL